MTAVDTLLAEAEEHPIEGWDFSWLGERDLPTAAMGPPDDRRAPRGARR